MTVFIPTNSGAYVASSEITSMHDIGDDKCNITTKSGEQHVIDDIASNLAIILNRAHAHVVPAAPGYKVIKAYFPFDSWSYTMLPVVGWKVMPPSDEVCYHHPLLSECPSSGGLRHFLLFGMEALAQLGAG